MTYTVDDRYDIVRPLGANAGLRQVWPTDAEFMKLLAIGAIAGEAGQPFVIGARSDNPGTVNFDGWMKDIRITKGANRYATDATVPIPASAFPQS